MTSQLILLAHCSIHSTLPVVFLNVVARRQVRRRRFLYLLTTLFVFQYLLQRTFLLNFVLVFLMGREGVSCRFHFSSAMPMLVVLRVDILSLIVACVMVFVFMT